METHIHYFNYMEDICQRMHQESAAAHSVTQEHRGLLTVEHLDDPCSSYGHTFYMWDHLVQQEWIT